MARKPESRLQRRIRYALETQVGGYWFKVHGNEFTGAGIPDLVGCVFGLAFYFEVKVPGEEPSPIQLWTMQLIRDAGGCVAVVISPEQAVRIVREWLEDQA